MPRTNPIIRQPFLGQAIPGYGSQETVPSLLGELIILQTSVGDDLQDSVERYVFITTRALRASDHNTQHHFDRLATVHQHGGWHDFHVIMTSHENTLF